MWHATKLHFAADHPALAGHFPGNPIVPGALLLDAVLAAVTGDDRTVTLRAAKFLHPVGPGQDIALRWQERPDGATEFECRLAGQDILAMTGILAAPAASP